MKRAIPGEAFFSGKASLTQRRRDGGTGCGGTGGLPGRGIGGIPGIGSEGGSVGGLGIWHWIIAL